MCSPLSLIPWRIAQALVAVLHGENHHALAVAGEGLDISKDRGVPLWEAQLHGMQAASRLSAGDLREGKRCVVAMAEALNQRPSKLDQSFYHAMAGWLALVQENYPLARHHATQSLKNTAQHGAIFSLVVEQLLMAWALLGMREPRRAKTFIRQGMSAGRRMKSHLFEWMGLLAQAQLAFGQGDVTAGRRALKKGFALGREKGLTNCFLWQPKVMAGLCQKALEWGIEQDYVQELIQKRGLVLDSPSVACDHWPWRLKIFCLGQFRIEKDGKPLTRTGKTPRRPLALLKALIAFGGKGVNETRLTDALWPDTEGDVAHKSFSVTLTRLRALLGVDGALELSDGKLSVNPQLCWIDTWVFEDLIKQVPVSNADRPPNKLNAEALKNIERALALYQGPFLGETPDEAWALPLQDRLHHLYRSAQLRIETSDRKRNMQ